MESLDFKHENVALKQYTIAEKNGMPKDGIGSAEQGPRQFDSQLHRRVLRKLDYFLMPTMVIGKYREHSTSSIY